MKIWALWIGFFFFSLSCASYIPEKEMAVARAALKAAEEANAPIHSPKLFQKAESTFRSAERAIEEKEFDLAKDLALKSRMYSERAENLAVLKGERGEQ